MITDYSLVTTYKVQELETSVSRMIKQGWQPYGPPFIKIEGKHYKSVVICVQGMVKYAEKNVTGDPGTAAPDAPLDKNGNFIFSKVFPTSGGSDDK